MRRGHKHSVPTFAAPDTRADEVAESLEGWEPADGIRGSSRAQAGTSRGVHALLWTLLTCAVLLGLVSLFTIGARRSTAAAPAGPAPITDMPPGGCAELLVTAWLAGDTGVLAALVGADVPRLPAGRRAASHTYTVSAQPVPGASLQWAYLVGADVVNADDKGGRSPAGVQFFTTTLTPAGAAGGGCGGWVAPALPAQTAGLAAAGPIALDYRRSMPVSGHPIADALAPFFTALLAGGGEVDRYLSPGMQLRAVAPAPYTQVRLEHLRTDSAELGQTLPADGTRVQLLATVAVRLGDQPGEWSLSYPLTVTVRGGRWEVTALDPAPVMATPPPSSTAPVWPPRTPSPSPTSSAAPTAPNTAP